MILIVDDDRAVRLAIGLALGRAGFETRPVGTESECLAMVREAGTELVILDMNLTLSTSGQQGLEILRKIKVLRPEIPVILISAWGTIPLTVEGMSLGAVDFLTKPWSNAVLVEKVKKALTGSKGKETAPSSRTLEELERDAVTDALRRCGGNQSEAARMLGISRQALYRKIQKLNG